MIAALARRWITPAPDSAVADAILEGRSQVISEMVAQPNEDFVEVEDAEKQ